MTFELATLRHQNLATLPRLWHREPCAAGTARPSCSLLASHRSSRRFLHASLPPPRRCRSDHARGIHRRRRCASSDAARAGRRAGMPRRRRQHRLHRRVRDQPRLCAARRRHAGGSLHRDHPQGRPRPRHHPGIGAGMGRVRPRRAARGPATSQATMPGAQGSATLGVGVGGNVRRSAAPTIRSRCSRSACRARSASTSRPGWKAWNFGRVGRPPPIV